MSIPHSLPRKARSRRLSFKPTVELLEDRTLPAQSSFVYPGLDGHLIYTPDARANRIPDFSNVGYQGGIAAIPSPSVRATVSPGEGDDMTLIQAAIDQVAALPLDPAGFRGTVLLRAGEYQISGQLQIRASGVVLRGEGDGPNGTILRATGTSQRSLILVSGSGSRTPVAGTTHAITDKYVPVGSRSFRVDSTAGLAVGDMVIINRPSTAEWIYAIGMDQAVAPYVPWFPGMVDLQYDRVITRIEGNQITLDAPLTNALDQQYGGGTIFKYLWGGRIRNVGVEYISGVSDFAGPTDEEHAWRFLEIQNIQHAWVRSITTRHFAFGAVHARAGTKWVTVQNANNYDPVSEIVGGRRYAFFNQGQLNLFRNLDTRDGRHDLATDRGVEGPNVFVDGRIMQSYDEVGPHAQWATGFLFDNITVTEAGTYFRRGGLNLYNRGNTGTEGNPLHGWTSANSVLWNSTAFQMHVQNPPTAQNWSVGGQSPLADGSGYFDSFGTPVEMRSLYYAQLQQRLDHPGLGDREYWRGDMDNLVHDGPADDVAVDPAWLTTVSAAAGSSPLDGFDVLSGNHWVPFSFDFGLGAQERVVGATLSLGLRSTSSSGNAFRIHLNNLTNPSTPAQLGWLPLTPTVTGARVLDLSNVGALLQTGQLNLALEGDVAVDWAVLNLQVAPGGPLTVTSFTPTPSGFTAEFSHPLNTTVLNLYDAPGGPGASDVTVIDTATLMPVRGSLVVAPNGRSVSFLRTGGPLPAGTYTITLRSAADAFQRATSGTLLDGNGDGIPGDSYTATISGVSSSAVVVSIPDFAHGPGQMVNVPVGTVGLPLRLSASTGVTSVRVTLRSDFRLLRITGGTIASGLPAGATVTVSTSTDGLAVVNFTTPPLGPNITDFVRLAVLVPNSAGLFYTQKHVLNLTDLSINDGAIPSVDDDGIHVAAYLGDTTGNGGYSSSDATQTLRVAVGLGTGFGAYQQADPVLVGDVLSNGIVNSTDALRILQESIGIDQAVIPPLPGVMPPIVPGGPDPYLNLPTNLVGRPGDRLSVPVNLDLSDGLESLDLALAYDGSRLEVIEVRRGSLTGDFDLFLANVDARAGTLQIGLGRTAGPISGQGSGSVLEIVFRIKEAASGSTVLNLRRALGVTTTQLNESGLDLIPDPSDEAGDVLDGLITIRKDRNSSAQRSRVVRFLGVPADGVRLLGPRATFRPHPEALLNATGTATMVRLATAGRSITTVEGNGDSAAGGVAIEEFFRLYSNSDGDHDLEDRDLTVLVSTLGEQSDDEGYLSQ